MTTITQLRALADRVCAEEPSNELSTAVLRAMPDDVWSKVSNSLRNLSDAAGMMPAGHLLQISQIKDGWIVIVSRPNPHGFHFIGCDTHAPTEPRARTAAALRVRAAMMEDGE